MENDPLGLVVFQPEHLGQVPRDGLPLAVFIGRQPNRAGLLGEFFQLRYRLLLIGRYFVMRCKIILDVDSQLFLR